MHVVDPNKLPAWKNGIELKKIMAHIKIKEPEDRTMAKVKIEDYKGEDTIHPKNPWMAWFFSVSRI